MIGRAKEGRGDRRAVETSMGDEAWYLCVYDTTYGNRSGDNS
jgi:hypothetical protein